jgi:hypothetical protein
MAVKRENPKVGQPDLGEQVRSLIEMFDQMAYQKPAGTLTFMAMCMSSMAPNAISVAQAPREPEEK